MLSNEATLQYETLNLQGQAAKDAGNHQVALSQFEAMDALAIEHGDNLRRLHALTPSARALWSMDCFDEASERLKIAASIAEELNSIDEQGITLSNMGRMAAVKTVRTVPIDQQAEALRDTAVPKFRKAYELLKGHPHLYYRYANAQHGSVVAALAGERKLTGILVAEGLSVVFRRSVLPYDQQPTYRISPKGLVQMAAAVALSPLGADTPVLASTSKAKLIR